MSLLNEVKGLRGLPIDKGTEVQLEDDRLVDITVHGDCVTWLCESPPHTHGRTIRLGPDVSDREALELATDDAKKRLSPRTTRRSAYRRSAEKKRAALLPPARTPNYPVRS